MGVQDGAVRARFVKGAAAAKPSSANRPQEQRHEMGNSASDWFPVRHGNHDVHREAL